MFKENTIVKIKEKEELEKITSDEQLLAFAGEYARVLNDGTDAPYYQLHLDDGETIWFECMLEEVDNPYRFVLETATHKELEYRYTSYDDKEHFERTKEELGEKCEDFVYLFLEKMI